MSGLIVFANVAVELFGQKQYLRSQGERRTQVPALFLAVCEPERSQRDFGDQEGQQHRVGYFSSDEHAVLFTAGLSTQHQHKPSG